MRVFLYTGFSMGSIKGALMIRVVFWCMHRGYEGISLPILPKYSDPCIKHGSELEMNRSGVFQS